MFVHTYFCSYAIIIDVTPPIHYIVFATPHKTKYLLLKEPATPLALLLSKNKVKIRHKNSGNGELCLYSRQKFDRI